MAPGEPDRCGVLGRALSATPPYSIGLKSGFVRMNRCHSVSRRWPYGATLLRCTAGIVQCRDDWLSQKPRGSFGRVASVNSGSDFW